jgi:hypothetical protein
MLINRMLHSHPLGLSHAIEPDPIFPHGVCSQTWDLIFYTLGTRILFKIIASVRKIILPRVIFIVFIMSGTRDKP